MGNSISPILRIEIIFDDPGVSITTFNGRSHPSSMYIDIFCGVLSGPWHKSMFAFRGRPSVSKNTCNLSTSELNETVLRDPPCTLTGLILSKSSLVFLVFGDMFCLPLVVSLEENNDFALSNTLSLLFDLAGALNEFLVPATGVVGKEDRPELLPDREGKLLEVLEGKFDVFIRPESLRDEDEDSGVVNDRSPSDPVKEDLLESFLSPEREGNSSELNPLEEDVPNSVPDSEGKSLDLLNEPLELPEPDLRLSFPLELLPVREGKSEFLFFSMPFD
mmetsp:Transcript_16988/g.25198  ORF Transcript_16988/g.25198 Transcript_16988/m.25198 type:complete len:276 (+) Transcript_16988:748-1575(+)